MRKEMVRAAFLFLFLPLRSVVPGVGDGCSWFTLLSFGLMNLSRSFLSRATCTYMVHRTGDDVQILNGITRPAA